MSLQLRPYQTTAIEASIQSPWQRQLIVLSTGMGKTITGLALAKHMGGRCLWLAHREELITQPAKALALIWPEVTHGKVKAERNEFMRHVVFASIQSAQQEHRAEQLARQGFSLVVVDEAHHALSPGYRSLLERLGCWRDGGPRLLGLTATPERSDNGALDEVFQGIVFQVGITTAIEQGCLVPPTVIERKIEVDLDSVTVSRGDFSQRVLDTALMQAGIVGEISSAYEENCAGKRKTIVFVVSVAQAEEVAKTLRDRGHSAAALSGETPADQRRKILHKLHTGEISCLVNCMVLTEGFDEPSVDAIILARPTQSKPLMIQCVGRGLRLYPGKSDCLVIDMVGASKRHKLVQAAVLFGVRVDHDETPRPKTIDPITDPEEYWRQRLLSQINGVKGAPRSVLRWVPDGASGWLLDAGVFGTVRMLPVSDEQWSVDAVGVKVGDKKRDQLSDCPVSMEIAQAIAEDYVRRVNAVNKSLADARWREGPATAGQVAFLSRAGVKNVDGVSRGTAADLELQVKVRHATEPATLKQINYLKRLTGVTPARGLTKREAMHQIIKYSKGREARR